MSNLPTNVLLHGIVKAVPSGDTIILMKAAPASRTGPPPEIRLSLQSVRAPALQRVIDGSPSGKDEHGAWGSREYLRRRLIGKNVGFIILDKVGGTGGQGGGRFVGEVYERKGDDGLRVKIVGEGWAKVVTRRGIGGEGAVEKSEEEEVIKRLVTLEEKAKKEGRGIWRAETVEKRILEGMLTAAEMVKRFGGKKVRGVVEYVANGSTFKIYFPRSQLGDGVAKDYSGMLCLAGIQCPGFRRPEGRLPDGSLPAPEPLPYALNARYLTQVNLLHRDVIVNIADIERNGLMFGSVEVLGKKEFSISIELLKRGFAKTASGSLEFADDAPALRAAERQARDARLALWKDYVPKSSVGQDESFLTGKVVEVVSGDLIAVMVDGMEPTAEPRRISLASVRAPRAARGAVGSRAEAYTGMGYVAKEALRKSLIGKRVNVKVEYVRQPSETAMRKTPVAFATVERVSDSTRKRDVALALISTGMLTVIRHRGDEERAANYEEYLEREKAAAKERIGVHKPNAQALPTARVNDLTTQDSKRRAESLLHELLKGNPHEGVIEYVSTASRYRIYFPKKAMLITLALKAVRVPQPTRRMYLPDGSVREEKAGEPHGDGALAFARERFMQRDVQVFVSSVDRVGAFLGSMHLKSSKDTPAVDVSRMLLEEGYGYIHESFEPRREPGGAQLLVAEKAAKDARKGFWVDYVEEDAVGTSGDANGVHGAAEKQLIKGTICEVGAGGRLYIHTAEASPILKSVEQGLAALSLDEQPPVLLANVKPGSIVCSKFSDGKWYRAEVLHKEQGHVKVHFIDYGNQDWVEAKDVVSLPRAGWATHNHAATKVTMPNIKVPDANEEGCEDAGRFLYNEVYGRKVVVEVVKRSKDALEGTVTVGDEKPAEKGLREKMLEAGVARIVRKSGKEGKSILTTLGPFEDVGKQKRAFLWRHGDPYASDEDDDELTRERNRRRYG